MPVTSACIGAAVPTTTALRWIAMLEAKGLITRENDSSDARRVFVKLSPEARQGMADYFARFGGLRRYLASVVDEAKTLGFTKTVYGRRRPFDDLNSKLFQVRENARRAALNAPIQGTAADIMKLAMTRIDQKMIEGALKSRMLLQVHDELVFEVAPGELGTLQAIVVREMEQVVKLSVPLDVHIGIGRSWDEAAH